ncbi:MAG: ROK family protein [Clostridia bacterium]|nr:ROK family protein [Clostridia bacterium]
MLLGIDIGGTKCALVLGEIKNSEVKIEKKVRFATEDVNKTVDRIIEEADGLRPFDAIGISCGGPLDETCGVIMSPPNLPGWDNVHITDILHKRYGVPTRLMNDANACALAEWKYGAGRGAKNMIFLTFGTGLGAGLILGGRLYTGSCGMAGEVGHIRLRGRGPVGYGKRGSFEGFCSGGGIANAARTLAKSAKRRGRVAFSADTDEKIEALNAEKIATLARDGDPDAKAVFDNCSRMLGEGLAILADVINPDRIVIGSIYRRCEDLLADGVISALKKEALSATADICTIVPSGLGESIGDVAAIAIAEAALNCN